MKKLICCFLIILTLGVIFINMYAFNPEVEMFVLERTAEDFSEENIYSDLKSLSVRLDEEIMKGSENFIVYLKGMDVNEIDQINKSLDGVFGSGSAYQKMGSVGGSYEKVRISVERTTNYYALKAYTDGESIPDTQQKAKQLYQVIRQIMATYVKPTMTDFEKEVVLHDYLVENCRYSENTSQPAGSDIYRAYGALVNGDAVCNGYAEALQLLFSCAGLETKFVVGKAAGIDHAWNLVKLDGMWYHLDATWNDPVPDQKKMILHSYFNVKDDIMAESHEWDREFYPKAFSMDYNYYVYNNLYFRDFNEYKQSAYKHMVNDRKRTYEGVMRHYQENENDMQFVFENNTLYESISWQTFRAENYCVLVLQVE